MLQIIYFFTKLNYNLLIICSTYIFNRCYFLPNDTMVFNLKIAAIIVKIIIQTAKDDKIRNKIIFT